MNNDKPIQSHIQYPELKLSIVYIAPEVRAMSKTEDKIKPLSLSIINVFRFVLLNPNFSSITKVE